MPQSSRHARLIAKLKPLRAAAPAERATRDGFVERNVYAYIAHKVGCEIVAGLFPQGTLLPNEEFIAELYTLRRMIEPEAAALAAVAPSPATIEQIGAAYADMVRFKDGAGDLISADLRFHQGILNATGNHFLSAFGSLIYAALFSTFRLSWEGAARIRDNRLEQHHAVYKAICDDKPDLARKNMRALISDSLGDVREFLRQRDERAGRAPSETRATP